MKIEVVEVIIEISHLMRDSMVVLLMTGLLDLKVVQGIASSVS